MPEANEIVGIMAVVAQGERKLIADRTKAALAAAKARGTKLGGFKGVGPSDGDRAASLQLRRETARARPLDLAPIVKELRDAGARSLGDIAKGLMVRGIPAARGGPSWSASQVSRLLVVD
jgi:DNA invertase Pin-like site-specific DNA recombinase